jgi:hypothetical protein
MAVGAAVGAASQGAGLLAGLNPITAGLSIASFGMQAFSFFSGLSNQSKADELQARQEKINDLVQKNDLRNQIAQTDVQINQTQDQVGLYEGFLSKFMKTDEYKTGAFAGINIQDAKESAQANDMFKQVFNSYDIGNVIASQKGQATAPDSSAGLVANESKANLIGYVDQSAKQLDIFKTSLSTLQQAKSGYEDVLSALS